MPKCFFIYFLVANINICDRINLFGGILFEFASFKLLCTTIFTELFLIKQVIQLVNTQMVQQQITQNTVTEQLAGMEQRMAEMVEIRMSELEQKMQGNFDQKMELLANGLMQGIDAKLEAKTNEMKAEFADKIDALGVKLTDMMTTKFQESETMVRKFSHFFFANPSSIFFQFSSI